MLRQRAEAGVKVRLCFGDPFGEASLSGREEGIGTPSPRRSKPR